MSTIGDALDAIKRVILMEERISGQGRKLEQLADAVVQMERRLALMEGRVEGFMAAAAAFRGPELRVMAVEGSTTHLLAQRSEPK